MCCWLWTLCHTTQHRAVLIIFPLNLQTITITRMLSSGGEGDRAPESVINRRQRNRAPESVSCWVDIVTAGNNYLLIVCSLKIAAIVIITIIIIIIIIIITINTQAMTYRVWGCEQVTQTAPLQVVSWVEGMKTCRESRMTFNKDLFPQHLTTQTACRPGTSCTVLPCRGATVPAALWEYLPQ